MATEIIQKIKMAGRIESVAINKQVIAGAGQVARFQRTFSYLVDWKKELSLNFFYRQARVSEDGERWNIYGKFLWYLAGIWFTNPVRAEIIIRHFTGFVEWLKSVHEPTRIKRDFLTAAAELGNVSMQITFGFIEKDMEKVRALLLRVQAISHELVEILGDREAVERGSL